MPGPRVALVTGGSSGIGREIAQRLAADGFAVAVVCSSTLQAEQAVAPVAGRSGRAIAIQAEITDPDAVEAAFAQAERAFGGVDVVINAASVMLQPATVGGDFGDLDRMYHAGIRGTFAVSQQAARRVRDGGAIVNFSSALTCRSIPAYAACNAGNAAVEDLTLLLTRELHDRDITVNVVVPGPAIVEVVAALAGPGRWISGQVIDANADLAMRNPASI